MAKNFRRLRWVWPALWVMGERGREAARLLRNDVPKLLGDLENMTSIPDRFNRLYLPRGWIASESIHFEAMRIATELGEANDLEAGEAQLMLAHDSEFLKHMLHRLMAVKAFRPRWPLVEKALEDHAEARYHASVPVVLAQIDGLVWDLANGTFYDPKAGMKLYAANTIAGHPEGLAALAAQMSKPRHKTTESVLSLPYRHGVLHGRDLGYATKENSTKALCALAALHAWATRIEAGTQEAEPPLEWLDPDKATWEDVKASWRELVANVRRADELAKKEGDPY